MPKDDLDLQFMLNKNWDSPSLSQKEQQSLKQLFHEAAWIFSGMIYGFRVDWLPAGPQRAERFSMESVADINQENIKITQTFQQNEFIIVNMEYQATIEETNRHDGWLSPAITPASGRSGVTIQEGSTRKALEESIREALYTELRKQLYNRPGLVKARVAFARFPNVRLLKSGYISVLSEIRIILSSVQTYSYH